MLVVLLIGFVLVLLFGTAIAMFCSGQKKIGYFMLGFAVLTVVVCAGVVWLIFSSDP